MSDVFELIVTVDLRDELSEQELAELRWHLGLGAQPDGLTVVTEFPIVEVQDDGTLRVLDDPRPLLAGRGAARSVGGALCGALVGREGLRRPGWSLTSRLEFHPDDCCKLNELLCWLAERAQPTHRLTDGAVWLGYFRSHEDLMPCVLEVKDGRANLMDVANGPE